MSKLIDADILSKTLTQIESSSKAMTTFTPEQSEDMSRLIKVVRLQYPNFKRPETTTFKVFYGVHTLGKGQKIAVVQGKSYYLHIEKFSADSELEVLKYCSENLKDILLIFNIENKNILFCAKKENENLLKENIIDHWNKIWKNKSTKLELPTEFMYN